MNDYIEARFDFTPCNEAVTDVMAALLADIDFESFVADACGVTAYVKAERYDEGAVRAVIENFPLACAIAFDTKIVEGRDWNAEWEKNYFRPIVAGNGRCVIHSSFHVDIPAADYDITIDPKMAFGTGHHATTSLITDRLVEMDLKGKHLFDMGTGTAILAILAAMRGARVTAVEIDEFAYVNALENVKLNGHPEIEVILGDAGVLENICDIDIFVANINRNVITSDLPAYVATLAGGATAIFSGFYVEDIPIVREAAERCGLVMTDFTERDRWASVSFKYAR